MSQPQVGAAQVLHQDGLAGGRRDVLGIVAAVALQPGVAAFERVARFAVIEFIEADVPADGDELLAIVLGVALGALVVAPRGAHQGGVQPLVGGEPLPDFHVAAGALQLVIAAAPADVAAGAMRRTVELGVGFGEVAGRKLGEGQRGKKEKSEPQLWNLT